MWPWPMRIESSSKLTSLFSKHTVPYSRKFWGITRIHTLIIYQDFKKKTQTILWSKKMWPWLVRIIKKWGQTRLYWVRQVQCSKGIQEKLHLVCIVSLTRAWGNVPNISMYGINCLILWQKNCNLIILLFGCNGAMNWFHQQRRWMVGFNYIEVFFCVFWSRFYLIPSPEFLKVADTQTHVCAKLSTTCAKFWILNAKL